jgi:hypothetical protein
VLAFPPPRELAGTRPTFPRMTSFVGEPAYKNKLPPSLVKWDNQFSYRAGLETVVSA